MKRVRPAGVGLLLLALALVLGWWCRGVALGLAWLGLFLLADR